MILVRDRKAKCRTVQIQIDAMVEGLRTPFALYTKNEEDEEGETEEKRIRPSDGALRHRTES